MGYGQKRVLCQQEKGNSEKILKKTKKTLKKLLTKRDFCGKINSVAEVITSDDG